MTVQFSLTERHQKILRATIKHYIATAEPVGSNTLIQEYDFSVSSATIRNAMGRLEKAGLLYQPHISAGRIPSDSGYRIYVDQLITPDEIIRPTIDKLLAKKLKFSSWDYEEIFKTATQIIANLSGCIALITLPKTDSNILRYLQLLRVGNNQIMLIMVIDTYQTESVVLENPDFFNDGDELPLDLIDSELQILSNFLNSKLRGRSLCELSHLDWSELDREFQRYANFIKNLLEEINTRYRLFPSRPMMIRGISEVLRQPEFSHIEQVQMLLHLLEEEQEQLLPLIFDFPESNQAGGKVKISIGSENPLESMRPCSLISALYYQGERAMGSVAIIGPTRMVYENAIALVESTAYYLSENLT
jgi:heat-inducible transcriptional repressor